MNSHHIILSASAKPLSVLFRQALERRCARVTVEAGDAAGRIAPVEAEGSAPSLRLALITWEDVFAGRDEGDARNFAESIERIGRNAGGKIPTAIVFVPYASFVEGTNWLLSGPESGGLSADCIARCASTLIDRSHVVGFVVTPMPLAPDWQGGVRSASALQRLLRVACMLTDEVRSKVPEYWAAYPLELRARRAVVPNAASIDAVVEGILGWLDRSSLSQPRTRLLWQQSLIPWSRVGALLQGRLQVSLRVAEDDSSSTAVDDLFNDMLDLRIGTRTNAAGRIRAGDQVECIDTDRDDGVIDRILQCAPGAEETSYQPLRAPDLAPVDGFRWTSAAFGRATPASSCRRGYFAGGAGPAVLLVSPYSIDPGYFAGLADSLLPDHRVLIWQPMEACAPHRAWYGDTIAEFTAGLREMLAVEAPAGVHVVAWCGGLQVAAAMVAESACQVCSLTLLAPDFGSGEADESDAHKSVVRFCQQLAARPNEAAALVEQARKAYRAAPSSLDQYRPGEGRKRSPLRFHPVGFWSSVPDDPFDDPQRTLAWATRTAGILGELEPSARLLLESDISKLVVLGTDDAMILTEAARRRIHGARRCEAVALLGGNHYFLLEHAPLVGGLLRRFFREGCVDGGADVAGRVRMLDPVPRQTTPGHSAGAAGCLSHVVATG